MRLKVLLSVIIICGATAQAGAQHYHLTLEKSIEVAKSRSYEMQRLLQDMDIASNDLKAAIASLRTNITLNLTAPNYTETIRTWQDSTGTSFYPEKNLASYATLTVNQPLPTDGNVSLTTGMSLVNDYHTDMRSANFVTRLALDQPLHAFWGYNSIRSNLKSARLSYELTSKTLKREELSLIYDVSRLYYGLLSAQTQREINAMNLERQTEAYEISRRKYDSGLIMEVDALQMEVDLAQAQNNYDMSLVNERASAIYFKEFLGIELDAQVTLENELEYVPVSVDPDLAVEKALNSRIEMRQRDINIELQKLTVKQVRAEGQVRADLSAYFERTGVSREQMELAFGNTIQNSFKDYRRRPSNFGVGFTVRIPILDWGRNKARVRSASIRLNQELIRKTETERAIEREVRNMVDDLAGRLRQLQILERAVEVAEKAFEITMQRYTDGVVDSQYLSQDRARLNDAYTTRLNAYIQYQLLLADLQRATFYDFVSNTPIVQ